MRTPKKTHLMDRHADHMAVWIRNASAQVTDMDKKYPGHPEMVDAFEILRTAKSELRRCYRFRDKANEQRNLSFEADSDEEAMVMLEQGAAEAKDVFWSVFEIDRLYKLFHDLAAQSKQTYEERRRDQFLDEMDRARNL